jgi:hypothetical protein
VGVDPKAEGPRQVLDCEDMFPIASPDEKYVAVMTPEATLQIVDLTSRSALPGWSGPKERQQLFFNWSPDAARLSIGCYQGGGLWIYDVQKKEASKILDGSYGWCTWSDPTCRHLAIDKVYAQWHHEIWVADWPLSPKPAASQTAPAVAQ